MFDDAKLVTRKDKEKGYGNTSNVLCALRNEREPSGMIASPLHNARHECNSQAHSHTEAERLSNVVPRRCFVTSEDSHTPAMNNHDLQNNKPSEPAAGMLSQQPFTTPQGLTRRQNARESQQGRMEEDHSKRPRRPATHCKFNVNKERFRKDILWRMVIPLAVRAWAVNVSQT